MPAFFKAEMYKMLKNNFQSFPLQVANLNNDTSDGAVLISSTGRDQEPVVICMGRPVRQWRCCRGWALLAPRVELQGTLVSPSSLTWSPGELHVEVCSVM